MKRRIHLAKKKIINRVNKAKRGLLLKKNKFEPPISTIFEGSEVRNQILLPFPLFYLREFLI
jgi:hypothetical protein